MSDKQDVNRINRGQTGSGDPAAISNLPLALPMSGSERGSYRSSARAEFIRQLIAERASLMPQYLKRGNTPDQAVQAYGAVATITVRRMPAGYHKTVLA